MYTTYYEQSVGKDISEKGQNKRKTVDGTFSEVKRQTRGCYALQSLVMVVQLSILEEKKADVGCIRSKINALNWCIEG